MKKALIALGILAVVLGGVFLFRDTPYAGAAEEVVDSYSESNYNTSYDSLSSEETVKEGQSFIGNGNTLSSAKFYILKYGNPTGNAVVKVYSHSGTYGVSSVPNTLLATSENFDVSTLSTSFSIVTFTFSGANKITLTNGTYYIVDVEYSGGDYNNDIILGGKSSGTHSGNSFYALYNSSSTYRFYSGFDLIFYVYGEASAIQSTATSSNSQPIIFD